MLEGGGVNLELCEWSLCTSCVDWCVFALTESHLAEDRVPVDA